MVLACVLGLVAPAVAAVLDAGDFGVRGDGVTDDTPALQRALDAARQKGGTVHLPAGRYLVAGSLTIGPGVVLRGEYVGPAGLNGTILRATGGKGQETGPGCLVLQGGANAVERIAIEYPEQVADGEPVPYPYAITGGPSCRIEDVFLYNAYQGINLDFCHLNLVRNVWGEALRVGIHADHLSDISRIENVHFWPFYTHNRPKLREWVQQHGVAFQFGRSDWQSCTNTFCYGYHTGYRFFTSQAVTGMPGGNGGTTNGSFVGIGADRCVYGIDVENAFAIGVSITNGLFAPFGSWDSRAVLLRKGNTGNLTLTGCNFWAVPDSLVEVQDGSLTLSTCNIHEWAVGHQEAPCFRVGGGRLNVSGCTFNQGGYLAELRGERSRVSFTGNTAPAPLTVDNGIGRRAAFQGNSPAVRPAKRQRRANGGRR